VTLAEQVVRLTQKSLEDLIRAIEALAPEAQTASPGGLARSPLEQLREVALAPAWLLPLLAEGRPHHGHEEMKRRLGRLPSDASAFRGLCEEARRTTSELCQAIEAFDPARLEEEVTIPFGFRTVLTMADVIGLHYWNIVYHLGQINQIQLMAGDREMH
jgi:hypothetical protein